MKVQISALVFALILIGFVPHTLEDIHGELQYSSVIQGSSKNQEMQLMENRILVSNVSDILGYGWPGAVCPEYFIEEGEYSDWPKPEYWLNFSDNYLYS